MEQYTGFSAHASLATIGLWMKKRDIWQMIEKEVTIKQKTIQHTPHEKLQDAFITILTGGKSIVEANQRVRPDKALQLAFGRKTCAEQSVISETINACTEKSANELERVLCKVYQAHSQGYRHDYVDTQLLLDVDFTGLLAGRQAEGASKGYFSRRKNARGRQLGRVQASQYDEIVCEQLYDGKVQLEKGLIGLVEKAESVLDLNEQRRQRVLLRVDGGGGTDGNINWALSRGYFWMSKVKNWQRTSKLVKPIANWSKIPELLGHEAAWVPVPHTYVKPTRQLAVRWLNPKGEWQYFVLVFNLTDSMLFTLAKRQADTSEEQELFTAILKAYNLRGGGVETSFKNSKQGLGLNQRKKKSFQAQRVLMLLAELAYNITVWVRNELAKHKPELQHYGMLRMIRDVFAVTGSLRFDATGCLVLVVFNKKHALAQVFQKTWLSLFTQHDLSIILDEI